MAEEIMFENIQRHTASCAMKNKSHRWLVWLAGALVAVGSVSPTQAHGGEDHGDEKPAATQTNANVTVRVARAGDYEITLKHAA